MKRKTKAAFLMLLGLAALAFPTGCGAEKTPYEINNGEDYTVSVKYDANGGTFTTNTSVIVDSYNPAELEKNSEGMGELALLPPDAADRGHDAFTAVKSGYFLAGWYAGRTAQTDSDGNTVYTYSEPWDFEEDLLEVDPEGEYSAEEPVLTLYAAWVPLFEIAFYDRDSGEYIESFTFNPTEETACLVPLWSEETGALELYHFPEKQGYTFQSAYYDEAGTQPVDTRQVQHAGYVDYETGTACDPSMNLYVEYMEGEWYHIYNAEQFVENASVDGSYELYGDLDFSGAIWPTALMYGNFSGVIKGNGHTVKNVALAQTNNSKVNAGLFGYLTETAELSDLTFENVEFTIQAGTRVAGTSYGLLAGTLSKDAAVRNVKILDSVLQIDTGCYFGVEDYAIGLVCGTGDPAVVGTAQIAYTKVGDEPESLQITVTGNAVTIAVTEK